MYKTFAGKYKSSVYKMNKKYRINGKFGIKYNTRDGEKVRYLYDEGFKRLIAEPKSEIDIVPNTLIFSSRSVLNKGYLQTFVNTVGNPIFQ